MRKRFRAVSLSLLLLFGLPAGLIVSNLHTFNRLTDESPIARLRFVPLAPQEFSVEVTQATQVEVPKQ